jgi:hypothetical protein
MNALKSILIISLISFSSLSLYAQSEYQSAIGLRLGAYTNMNVTYKHFLNDQAALELVGGLGFWAFGYTRMGLAGIYQHHMPLKLDGLDGLNWYLGVGAYTSIDVYRFLSNRFNIGGMVGVGLDYKFPDYPVNVSIDFYPALNIINRFYITAYGGVAVRYVLN